MRTVKKAAVSIRFIVCLTVFSMAIGCKGELSEKTDEDFQRDTDPMEDFQSDRDIELADPVVAEQQESELEDSLRAFASVVVPASQEFLDNTPLVRLFIEETITLKMSVHLRMLDSYEVNVSSTGAFSEGVINTRIESILDSDPLGRKNIKMGSTQTVPLRCKYRDGVWELEGDTLGELISGLEKAGGFNNPDEEFEARMKSFDRQIKSITNPTGL